MSSVIFLLAVLAIAGIVVWSIMNDEVAMDGETHWLFAMRDRGLAEDADPAPTPAPGGGERAPSRTGPRNPS